MARDDDEITPVRQTLPPAAVEVGNGNGHPHGPDMRADPAIDGGRPYRRPRTPAEIAANAAVEAHRASLESSGMAGEMLGRASLLELAQRDVADRVTALGGKVDAISDKVDAMQKDLREVARAAGIKRTFSGSLHVSIPPPVPPIEIKAHDTLAGEHKVIENAEYDRLVQAFRDREAEERGAKEALAEMQEAEERRREEEREKRAAEAHAEMLADAKRKHHSQVMTAVGLLLALITTALSIYAAAHVSLH